MRFLLCAALAVCSVLFTATMALAQCQLATDDPPPPADEAEYFAQLDLSLADGIDPYLAELPEVPPAFAPLVFNKALEAARNGELELAARLYHFLLMTDPKPVEVYNLSCVYSLMNRPELAISYLDQAVRFGWTDLGVVDTDPDFANVRENEAFKAKLSELRERQATQAQSRGALAYAPAPVLMPYRLHLPQNYDAQQTYDLVLALHGAQDSAENFARLWGYFDQPGFILAVPQAPYAVAGEWRRSGNVWFNGQGGPDLAAVRQQTLANEQYLLDLLAGLRSQHKIRNVYLLGFSQGAVQAYATALHHPAEITGIIVFGGAIPEEMFSAEELASGKAVRVFIAHGREDHFDAAQSTYDRLSAAGYSVQLFPYDGGHYINLTALKTAQSWLSQTN